MHVIEGERAKRMSGSLIAVIGVGNMGSRMATRLVDAGYEVTVFDLDEQAVSRLVGIGAQGSASVAEACAGAEFVLTSLPNPSILANVIREIAGAANPGTIVLDFSTVDPASSRDAAATLDQSQIDFLDVPVSGGTLGAEQGTLVVMAGGPDEVIDRAQPVLDVLASQVVRCGGIGTGQLTKLAHNLLTAINTVALGEVLTASVAAGADLDTLREVLSAGLAGSKMLDYLPRTLLTDERPANFALDLMNKDIGLALKMFEHQPMYLGQITRQVYNTAAVQGLGGEDSTSVANVYEQLNGVRLQAKTPALSY